MGLPRVESFLCCISLETGCLVIGWVSVIISVLSISGLSLTVALYALGIAHITQESMYHIIFLAVMITCGIYIVYFLFFLSGAILLIMGIQKRDHTKMILYMILIVIGKFLGFLQTASMGIDGVIIGSGYVCGWFSTIVSGIALIGNLIALFSGMFATQSAEWWTILILNTIFLCIYFYASVMLINGTKNSNPGKMRLYLIIMLISVIFAFLQIILGGWGAIVGAIIWAFIVLYFFVCIHSLFKSVGGTRFIC